MEAYGEAGADILFVEALESEDEMRTACAGSTKPMMANMADGGLTPIRSAKELAEIGYALAIFPATTGLAAAQAAATAFSVLREQGTSASPDLPLYNFSEFNELIGFPEVWDFERKWARSDDKPAA